MRRIAWATGCNAYYIRLIFDPLLTGGICCDWMQCNTSEFLVRITCGPGTPTASMKHQWYKFVWLWAQPCLTCSFWPGNLAAGYFASDGTLWFRPFIRLFISAMFILVLIVLAPVILTIFFVVAKENYGMQIFSQKKSPLRLVNISYRYHSVNSYTTKTTNGLISCDKKFVVEQNERTKLKFSKYIFTLMKLVLIKKYIKLR